MGKGAKQVNVQVWLQAWHTGGERCSQCPRYLQFAPSHIKLTRSRPLTCVGFLSKRGSVCSQSKALGERDWNLRELPVLAKLMPLLKPFQDWWVAELSPSSLSTLKYLKKQRCTKRTALTLLNISHVSYALVLLFTFSFSSCLKCGVGDEICGEIFQIFMSCPCGHCTELLWFVCSIFSIYHCD